MTKRDIAQAILLGLLYVQSCSHAPPVNLKGERWVGHPAPLPVPTRGREKHRARIEKLLQASDSARGPTATGQRVPNKLSEVLAFMKLQPSEIKCYGAGCIADVVYTDIHQLVDTDRTLGSTKETPLRTGPDSIGRTPPRYDGERIVASWYVLTPPDKARIERFLNNKEFINDDTSGPKAPY